MIICMENHQPLPLIRHQQRQRNPSPLQLPQTQYNTQQFQMIQQGRPCPKIHHQSSLLLHQTAVIMEPQRPLSSRMGGFESNGTMALATGRPRSSSRQQRRNDPPAYPNDSHRHLSLRSEHIMNTNQPQPPLRPIPRAAPYRLGQSARPDDIVRFQSIHEAHSILPTLPIGTPLFVKRSNKDWTYARIVSYRRADSVEMTSSGMMELGDEYWNEGKENFIVVALDEDYLMRKFIQKEKWHSCVRLVRLAKRENESHVNHYTRHNSQPDVIHSDPLIPKLSRKTSAPEISFRSDDADSTAATYSPNRGENTRRYGKTSVSQTWDDAISVESTSRSVRTSAAQPPTESAPIPKSRSAVSFKILENEWSTKADKLTLAPVSVREHQLITHRESKSAHRARALNEESQPEVSNISTKKLPAPIPKVKSAPDLNGLQKRTPNEDDVDSTAGVAEEPQTTTSTTRAASETNPYVRSAEKNKLFRRTSAPVICAITNSPGTDSTTSSSSPASVLGHAKVNLNAKHFCGKRRDRMRPQKRRSTTQ